MSTDEQWDDILDSQTEIRALDEGFVYRRLGQINELANSALWTIPDDLKKPLLAIMDYAQRARARLIDG